MDVVPAMANITTRIVGDEAPEALVKALREFRLHCDGSPCPAD
jgi:hypothetical protein